VADLLAGRLARELDGLDDRLHRAGARVLDAGTGQARLATELVRRLPLANGVARDPASDGDRGDPARVHLAWCHPGPPRKPGDPGAGASVPAVGAPVAAARRLGGAGGTKRSRRAGGSDAGGGLRLGQERARAARRHAARRRRTAHPMSDLSTVPALLENAATG